MNIKYEVHTIENASGTGKKRQFIRLRFNKPMPAEDLESEIEQACSLTSSDVKAVLSELRRFIIRELVQGSRFHLPEIGYLSLTVGNTPPSEKPNGKITGNDIYVKNISFKPEAQLLDSVRKQVHFEKSKYTTRSRQYTEEELWPMVRKYIVDNQYLTRRDMHIEFSLSDYMTKRWLTRFVAEGLLLKKGTTHHPLYFLAEKP